MDQISRGKVHLFKEKDLGSASTKSKQIELTQEEALLEFVKKRFRPVVIARPVPTLSDLPG